MSIRLITGDCREVLATLPDESVHCCVTSPPYWGLRDYGVDGQIGLEASVQEHIEILRDVFREVRRVLRKDGTCWVNYGDAYAGGQGFTGRNDTDRDTPGGRGGSFRGGERVALEKRHDLKPKDLIGLPWRLAFALQADGWWLRSDIIWAKPNPMPESIRDRCTKAHEYIFMLAKSERYFFDGDAIAEDAVGPAGGNTKPNRSVEHDPVKHRTKAGLYLAQQKAREAGGFEKRNARTVWEIPSAPFSEAHFATFPPALAERCIKAGCPVGGTVLDPFGGAGTTGLVADRLQRDAILIELNPEYAAIAERRIHRDAPLFAEVSP